MGCRDRGRRSIRSKLCVSRGALRAQGDLAGTIQTASYEALQRGLDRLCPGRGRNHDLGPRARCRDHRKILRHAPEFGTYGSPSPDPPRGSAHVRPGPCGGCPTCGCNGERRGAGGGGGVGRTGEEASHGFWQHRMRSRGGCVRIGCRAWKGNPGTWQEGACGGGPGADASDVQRAAGHRRPPSWTSPTRRDTFGRFPHAGWIAVGGGTFGPETWAQLSSDLEARFASQGYTLLVASRVTTCATQPDRLPGQGCFSWGRRPAHSTRLLERASDSPFQKPRVASVAGV